MTNPIRLCLVLHNHQPIGNFDGVFEQAYRDSYLPFLEVFEPYSHLSISLHTSGPLMEWLDEKHPEYLDRLAVLVGDGRIEIVGGAFYEPILAMIPPRDRQGQIRSYTHWLEKRLGAQVQGMWIPERVWEQSLTSDIVEAGIQYTVLDDSHFRNAGLRPEELQSYYVTEDNGRVLSVFPGAEWLRYAIPYGKPAETVGRLREIAEQHPHAVAVFGDDGEKFGTWPDTKQHVYDNGWLREFFDALTENREWLLTSTLADAVQSVPPAGKVYLPDASYREMTEWALPVERQEQLDDLAHEMHDDPRWQQLEQFMRGGFWRNFKVKYTETNDMYARMMMVSRRLEEIEREVGETEEVKNARQALYRGQCNCSYWHGAFGGVYLPHLRNAVYNQLIAADNLLDRALGKPDAFVEATVDDYNFDARQEVRLTNDKLSCLLTPAAGGQMYELDVRSICHNLLATLTRRHESYHRKVRGGAQQDDSGVASIHDRVVFKQEGLQDCLQYDQTPRRSLIDHFFDNDIRFEAVRDGQALQRGDFAKGVYVAKLRRNADRIQVQMTRTGNAWGIPLTITKGVTTDAGSNTLEIAYLLEGLPPNSPLHFATEFNFAGMPAGADDRYFYRDGGERIGQLGEQLDLTEITHLGLVDEWLGMDVQLTVDQPTSMWAFPVQTVSNSEAGFELVHQSVAVYPHWIIQGDADGRWSVTMQLAIDTQLAESRMQADQVKTTSKV